MLPHIFEFERRLPAWLRPTSRGALCMLGLGVGVAGKLYVLALLATLMLMVGAGNGVVLFFGLLGVTMAAGAAGGMIHGLLGRLVRWGPVGVWLRWSAAILGAFIASVLLTPRGPFSLEDPIVWVMAVGIAALGAGGMALLDERQPGRLTPHQFRWLQKRDRRWNASGGIPARSRLRAVRGSIPIRRWSVLPSVVRWWRARRHAPVPAIAVRHGP